MSNFSRVVLPPYHFDHDGAPLLNYLLIKHRNRVIDYMEADPVLKYDKSSDVGPSEQHLQNIINNTDYVLRMYGSAEELAKNLKIYRNFPANFEFFPNQTSSYCTTPIIYYSLKNEKYICKSDLFSYLQGLTLSTHKELGEDLFLPFISVYLKRKEKEISEKSMNFIRFNPQVFDEIEKEFKRRMEVFEKTLNNASYPMSTILTVNYDANQIFEKLKKLVPGEWNEIQEKHVRNHIIRIYKKVNELERKRVFDWCFFNLKNLMETFEFIIGKWPELFGKCEHNSLPKIIRLFEDGGFQFSITSEVCTAANILFVDHNEFSYDLLDFQQIRNILKEKFNNSIEFIRMPILRAKHKAVPIKAPNGFCILAVDALFEILRNLIFGAKLFQHGRKYDDLVTALFKELERGFMDTSKGPYLVKLEECNELMNSLTIQLDELAEKRFLGKTKDVRNAKKDGFTAENLRNELKNLNLIDYFPEILDYARVVFNHVDQIKKGEFLRTCDLFDAVEMCQMICIFNKFPDLKKFLHCQKACGRVLTFNCYSCSEASKKSTSTVTPTSSESKMTSESAPESQKPSDVVHEFLIIQNKNQKGVISLNKESTEEKFSEILKILKSTSSENLEKENQKSSTSSAVILDKKSGKNAPESTKSTSSESTSGKKGKKKDSESTGILKSTSTTDSASDSQKNSKNGNQKKAPESSGIQKVTSSKNAPESTAKIHNPRKEAPESTVKIQNPQNPVRNQKSTSTSSGVQNPKKEDVKAPESANCVKCYRTCEMLNETKKELKSTQNKLKISEKKISEFDTEKKTKQEKILEKKNQELEQKILEFQKILEEKDKEMEEKSKEMKKINERILERKQTEIEKNMEKISILEAKNEENERILERKQMELEGFRREIQNIKKPSTFSADVFDHNLELKQEILSLKDTNLSQKQSFLDQKSIILERMGHLETENQNLKLKFKDSGVKNHEKRRFERENHRIHVENICLKTENETKERVIQQLIDKLATCGIQNSEDVVTTTSSEYLQYPQNSMEQQFEPQYPVTSSEMNSEFWNWSSEVATSSESPIFEEFYTHEVFRLPTSSRMTPDAPEFIPAAKSAVVKAPESSIPWFAAVSESAESATSSSSIQKASESPELSTTSSSSSLKAPESPNPKNSKKWTSSAPESPESPKPKIPEFSDSECPICLDEVDKKQKKINCNQCKKSFHSHCASTWLRVKSECPACRGRLLDPNEFPTLS